MVATLKNMHACTVFLSPCGSSEVTQFGHWVKLASQPGALPEFDPKQEKAI